MQDFELEICAGNIQSVIAAYEGGAHRVELCDNLHEGGTTPSIGTIIQAKERTAIDVFVLIRPRGGDFVYDDLEMEVMLSDIKMAASVGVDGFVIGCLTREGGVDFEKCSRLIDAAKDKPITFHRAFDATQDPYVSLEKIKALGVQRLLTSGQANKAMDGVDLLRELQVLSGNTLKIMAGSGIDEANIERIAVKTNLKAFHASLREEVQTKTKFVRREVFFNSSKSITENNYKASSTLRVKSIIEKLNNL